jgi:hypothetical protein
MDYPTDHPNPPQPRRHKEFEDPHYHDADEVDAPDDPATGKKMMPLKGSKLPRRILPPMRRRYEE